MRFEHVESAGKKYVLQIFSDSDVLIRRDDAGSPGWGTKIGSVHGIEAAMEFIRSEGEKSAKTSRYYLLSRGQNFAVESEELGPAKICHTRPDGTLVEIGSVASIGEAVRFSGVTGGTKYFEFPEPMDFEDHDWASLDLD